MSLQHALLTSLVEKPCSGYELARRFDKSIGYFWHATHQQIYRELARMEEQGWVHSMEVEGGRAGKREFAVLAAGRHELQRWASEQSEPIRLRDDMMVKLRADAAVGPLGLADEFERRLRLHEQELQTYREIEQRDFSAVTLSRESQVHYLILKAGIAFEESRVQWTKEAIAMLRDDENTSLDDADIQP
ncbi:PadR family transcriptional regulator [Undibacterium sp. RuRC25W]|uniref:PadR family transcriptional regulator n=1 Tax=Undibacterium sp. RuRC25W TaxID=3413047 RepID=UPI003BEF4D47